ncbi:MAG: hypothetical protein Q8M95_15330 [Candidatus Methanoperedens sp.]|nr:hypothetical protein [Candidatus Methanoperedens sp.]
MTKWVLLEDGTIIPLESKYRNNIQKKELRINGNQIILLPLWKWLLQLKEIGIEKSDWRE